MRAFPWNLEVREAYVEIYDFPLDRLDFRAGCQLIPWGTGDLVSPTVISTPWTLRILRISAGAWVPMPAVLLVPGAFDGECRPCSSLHPRPAFHRLMAVFTGGISPA